MKDFEFAIIASGVDPESEGFEDRFFNAGCDDATISVQKGAVILEFTREGASFASALRSAVSNVEAAGAKVVHVEPDYLVSLSDIAARADLSRSAVSLYAKGDRGVGFPAPVSRVTTESPLWDWCDVARWLHRQRRLPFDEVVRARVIRAANLGILVGPRRRRSKEPARSAAKR